jgi:GcrA cell cycle regulator
MTEPRLIANTPWAEELAIKAREMWRNGLSASDIGNAIHKSRSAVMGKVHRMGLRREQQANAAPAITGRAGGAIQQATKRYKQKKRAPWSGVAEIKPEVTPTAVGIVELERHHCRWPVSGTGADTLFCGGAAVKDFPYCVRHCRLAYRGTAG